MSTQQIETAPGVPGDHHPRWSTEHIAVDPSLCEACGDCTEVCRNGALSMVGFLFQRRAKVNHLEECRGCGECAAACPNGAIVPCGLVHAKRRSSPLQDA